MKKFILIFVVFMISSCDIINRLDNITIYKNNTNYDITIINDNGDGLIQYDLPARKTVLIESIYPANIFSFHTVYTGDYVIDYLYEADRKVVVFYQYVKRN